MITQKLIVLSLDEVKDVFSKFCQYNYLTQSVVLNDWIEFQHKATTTGVTQFDFDQMTLSNEDFEAKYINGNN